MAEGEQQPTTAWKWAARAVGGIVAVWIAATGYRNVVSYFDTLGRLDQAQHAAAEARRAREERDHRVPVGAVTMRKGQGVFSHTLYLRNASAAPFARCDLTLVVVYEGARGRR